MLPYMNQDEAASLIADKSFLQKFEELFDLNHTGQLPISEYLLALDNIEIPSIVNLPKSFEDFRNKVASLIENKNSNGFHNADVDLMHTEIHNFYKFIESIENSEAVIEINRLVRMILEYLQDTPISHLPELLFTAVTGSRNRAFATAVVRRFDMPL